MEVVIEGGQSAVCSLVALGKQEGTKLFYDVLPLHHLRLVK